MPFISIQLSGLDDPSCRERRGGHVVFYGHRTDDVARRVVGVAVADRDAREIMTQARYTRSMPAIEVDDRYWFYVAVAGAAVWEKGEEPQS